MQKYGTEKKQEEVKQQELSEADKIQLQLLRGIPEHQLQVRKEEEKDK